jgi:Fic family protein
MRRLTYIHERAKWPRLHWAADAIAEPLARIRLEQGRLIGRMEGLGFDLQQEAVLETLTEDVVKSSQIEGEQLDPAAVRSSIATRLGIDIGALQPADRHVDGVVEMMLDATSHYDKPLTTKRLHSWHAALFPTGRSGMRRIRVGRWRDDSSGPMQVVSGPIGRQRVHFEAPEAARLKTEMAQFLSWFEGKEPKDDVLRSGLAHFWFVTIHPFDDGNGRIARAIADLALARSESSSRRFYSMSAQIQRERKTYYDVLEQSQRGTTDVTMWMTWYLECLERAIEGAQGTLGHVIAKAKFWERLRNVALNERQRIVIGRFVEGFEGKLTTGKWAKLAKISNDTALRDIQQLVDKGVLVKDDSAGGRSTSYVLRDFSWTK